MTPLAGTVAVVAGASLPDGRIGRPDETGPLAVDLASAASDFMTGQTPFLDAGHPAA